MSEYKIIKDNVHGYISIPKSFFRIIDTAFFQRLKYISQTSYACLYPSSTHNRFVHSLGVFHLGKLAIESIWEKSTEFADDSSINKDTICNTFLLACLLHDVGHSPFSHTGEDFYYIKKSDSSVKNHEYLSGFFQKSKTEFRYIDVALINELQSCLGGELDDNSGLMYRFISDYAKVLRDRSAKPHEKMSAFLGLHEFKEVIKEISVLERGREDAFDADLFVRAITGTKYVIYGKSEPPGHFLFYNAIIGLLNSDLIDVDKLDYILRDCQMTGHKNTDVDVERLINALAIVKDNGLYSLVYKKNALSVIENVVRANDSSKKWLQGHPVVIYDTYLTRRCMGDAFEILKNRQDGEDSLLESFFSAEALTFSGVKMIKEERVFLISDADVLSLMKKAYWFANEEQKRVFNDYFDRRSRCHPIWKSEAEYKALFIDKKTERNQIESNNLQLIHEAVSSIDSYKNLSGVGNYYFTEDNFENIKETLPDSARRLLCVIKKYQNEHQLELDIVILSANSYVSQMRKLNSATVKVYIPGYGYNGNDVFLYSDLMGEESSGDVEKVFYMYSHHHIDPAGFANYLIRDADYNNCDT